MEITLQNFGDFVVSSREKIVHSPKTILNDASLNTYEVLNRMLLNKQAGELLQTGNSIIANMQLVDQSTAEMYGPNADLEPKHVSVLRSVKIPWRFIVDHFTYTQEEIHLSSGFNNEVDQKDFFTDLLKAKRQGMVTSTFNKMESYAWRRPSVSEMEAASGLYAYSIPAFITTNTGGLVPYAGADGQSWTTLQGLNPASHPNYRNQQQTYNPAFARDPNVGIIAAFDNMWHKVKFKSPRSKSEYFEQTKWSDFGILTNRDGRVLYIQITRGANDSLIRKTDTGSYTPDVEYGGIPVEYESTLDTAVGIYGANNNPIPAGEPVYYWMNYKFIKPVFHARVYMKEHDPMAHPRQPFTRVVWQNSYYNIICLSRRRQGIVFASQAA